MTKSITLKKLRPNLPKVVNEVDSKMDRFIITKRGKPVAMMISVDDYEILMETLSVLSDPKLVRRIRRAEKEVRNGNTIILDKVEKELGIV